MVHGVLFKMKISSLWNNVMFVKVLVNHYLEINPDFLLFFFVAPKSTLPTDIGSIDEVTDASVNRGNRSVGKYPGWQVIRVILH